jgi:outer membrane receptor for ferrienterochelin and colicin
MKKDFLNFKILGIICLLIISSFTSAYSQKAADTTDFLNMSLEQLMNMEITSVSKKAEKLQNVPSSIYVITNDDIQRSSAQNLMQLLRDNVPGYWAVANDYKNTDAFIRSTYEGSVLVLLNGTPMLDNMFMNFDNENFEIPFEMIDRIEVIKGSGGTVYGANSATGVISIITKKSDKASRFYASGQYSLPGKADLNFIATPVKSDKFSATIYGKYSLFNGFDQMATIKNNSSVVKSQDGTHDTTIFSRFTGNDNKYTSMAIGLNLAYIASEKMKFSTALSYSTFSNDRYYQIFPSDKAQFIFTGDPNNPKLYAGDSVTLKNFTKTRFVGNAQMDYAFSSKHKLFARVSTNAENSMFSLGGGFTSKNNIVDFELQDNLELGINQLSFGGNYRMVNFNLTDFVPEAQVLYVDPKNSQSLKGFFAQDKISLLDGKLNLYIGLKAENYSLINNKYYLSPMVKFSYNPVEKVTIWGGFTQSYTTPGYNQTNVEYSFFNAKSPAVFYNFTYPMVAQGVYQAAYDQAISGGADPATASAMAQGYISSPAGKSTIDAQSNGAIASSVAAYPGHFNVAAINGPNTKPTSFQNYELGLRLKPLDNLSFETSFFYSNMTDGIMNSPDIVTDNTPSLVQPGENIKAYYYGNYIKGQNMGLETVLKYYPVADLMFEVSHSWFIYSLQYQVNGDFSVAGLSNENLTPKDNPQIPEHVYRAKIYYTYHKNWKLTFSTVYSSAFDVKFGTISPSYSYQNQRFDPLYGDGGVNYHIGGSMSSRFILNARIDRLFLDQKLDVYLFGYDMANSSPYVEGVNQIKTTYPRQVGGMFGAGISYKF